MEREGRARTAAAGRRQYAAAGDQPGRVHHQRIPKSRPARPAAQWEARRSDTGQTPERSHQSQAEDAAGPWIDQESVPHASLSPDGPWPYSDYGTLCRTTVHRVPAHQGSMKLLKKTKLLGDSNAENAE